jgi:hypothetical protein
MAGASLFLVGAAVAIYIGWLLVLVLGLWASGMPVKTISEFQYSFRWTVGSFGAD